MPTSSTVNLIRWAAEAAAAVLLVLVGVWLGGRGANHPEPAAATSWSPTSASSTITDPPPPAPTTPGPGDENTTPATYASACGLSGGTTELLTRAPSDVTWRNDGGWYFPLSPSAGPGTGSSCFARTPAGALLAGYTISMLVDGLADDFARVVTDQTVPGVGQTVRLGQGALEKPTTVVIPKGFVLDRYTTDEATMSFYLTTAGQDVTCSFSVQWYENDWRLKLQQNGNTPGGCIAAPPIQFTPWGP